jgi:hypothetical protein
MLLFDDVVEVFDPADRDCSIIFLAVALDGGFIGVTPVNRDLSGTPFRRIAFLRNRNTAFWSRCSVSRQSTVSPYVSTAQYRYRHSPLMRMYVSSIRQLIQTGRLRRRSGSSRRLKTDSQGGLIIYD